MANKTYNVSLTDDAKKYVVGGIIEDISDLIESESGNEQIILTISNTGEEYGLEKKDTIKIVFVNQYGTAYGDQLRADDLLAMKPKIGSPVIAIVGESEWENEDGDTGVTYFGSKIFYPNGVYISKNMRKITTDVFAGYAVIKERKNGSFKLSVRVGVWDPKEREEYDLWVEVPNIPVELAKSLEKSEVVRNGVKKLGCPPVVISYTDPEFDMKDGRIHKVKGTPEKITKLA